MAVTTTRTLNPLPFEHLEPKRFEDLARQLAYGFRVWRQLEATGRAGSDSGFDARGVEIDASARPEIPDDDGETPAETATDRLWLIQCKREKSIGPAQMRAHLATIPEASTEALHGVLFIAACDFSLKTREALRDWCRARGVSECIIWGRGELEDLLFQPINDGLLFAYFGISLRIQRQRVGTALRRTITLKRKLKRLFETPGIYGDPAVFRDPSDERYPYVAGGSLKADKALWLPRSVVGIGPEGLEVVLRQFWAYYDHNTGHWDFASGQDFSIPNPQHNPWHAHQIASEPVPGREIVDYWSSLPRERQYFWQAAGCIPYEEIIEIDDVGDNMLQAPTVFVRFKETALPYDGRIQLRILSGGVYNHEGEFDPAKHVLIFPDELRNPEWEARFFKGNGYTRGVERPYVELTEPEWKRRAQEQAPPAQSE